MIDVPCDDPIVEAVIAKFRERSRVGVAKYGTTLHQNNGGIDYWLNHVEEELMDALNYVRKLRVALSAEVAK
jgi:hypothetical protein